MSIEPLSTCELCHTLVTVTSERDYRGSYRPLGTILDPGVCPPCKLNCPAPLKCGHNAGVRPLNRKICKYSSESPPDGAPQLGSQALRHLSPLFWCEFTVDLAGPHNFQALSGAPGVWWPLSAQKTMTRSCVSGMSVSLLVVARTRQSHRERTTTIILQMRDSDRHLETA